MATTGTVQSFGVLNYSGMLFNKGNTLTPFSTMIANRARNTNHVEFTTGLEFTTEGGTQPAITETDSLTAPDPTYITRTQKTNVTQIFHESVAISYAKESNMGTLSGLNINGQVANPAIELDFQVAAKMNKIARDIEYTFINGAYVKAANDATANKTRGMVTAITTNVYDMSGAALRVWDVAIMMDLIKQANGSLTNLVLWVDSNTMMQLNADAEQNGLTVVPASRNVNGIQLTVVLTALGPVGLYLGEFLPAGTALLINPAVIGRVEQPVPGKGNFFMEELAQIGAGTKYQIFGQLGLDHGPEWYHGKFTNINNAFVIPPSGKKIYAVDPIPAAIALPVIYSVVLSGTPQQGVATSALSISYAGTPSSAPTLAYQWQVATSPLGTFTNLGGTSTSATYTPLVGDVGKFIRCEVTATDTATGVKVSNSKKVIAAD